MLTSLAATQAPVSATRGSRRTSSATRPPRAASEEKNGKSGRIVPSRQHATSRTCPAAAARTDSSAPARPRPNAETAAGPSLMVRWPPTTGTRYSSEPWRRPSSTRRATASGPTTVSTIAMGQAPMAHRSFTLVSTAETPVLNGSASTNRGSIASPPTTSEPVAVRDHGAVVAGAREPVGRPERLGDQADRRLAEQTWVAAGLVDHLLEERRLGHGPSLSDRGTPSGFPGPLLVEQDRTPVYYTK